MDAGKRTLEHIFNKGRSIEVPFFQRSYVWNEENWERFVDDMQLISEQKHDYFMGSLILKALDVPSDRGVGDLRALVDGQQRLTTLNLFFKVLCDVQNRAELFKDTFFNRESKLILKHNHNDISAFEGILKNEDIKILRKEFKGSRILDCYSYFLKRADDIKAINVNHILNHIYFVGIDLSKDEDEQQIFDTINSLGVSLTTAELLKNELYRRNDIDLYTQTWRETFEKDDDSKSYWDQAITSGRQIRNNIDVFLQAFLLIKSDAKEKYLSVESLFTSYKYLLKEAQIERVTFINELIEYAQLYRKNFDPDFLNQDIDKDSGIQRLNVLVFGLSITTIVPYMLFVLKETKDAEEQRKIFGLLESFLVRRLICRETTKGYNKFFASLIRNRISSYNELKFKIDAGSDLTTKFPNDDAFQGAFHKNQMSNDQAKIVLYLLEKSLRDEKMQTSLRPVNKYTLEHIMPKNWAKNWKNDLSENARDERDQLLLTLGNLTLLTSSLNSSIRDANWDTKKNGRGKMKGLKECGAGIKIFEKFLEGSNWDEKTINGRALFLLENALKVWK